MRNVTGAFLLSLELIHQFQHKYKANVLKVASLSGHYINTSHHTGHVS